MRTERVHILLEPEERARFARAAERCGESLSAWLRRAAHERLQRARGDGIDSVSELAAFFRACEADDDGTPEPGWDEQKRAIDASRATGGSGT